MAVKVKSVKDRIQPATQKTYPVKVSFDRTVIQPTRPNKKRQFTEFPKIRLEDSIHILLPKDESVRISPVTGKEVVYITFLDAKDNPVSNSFQDLNMFLLSAEATFPYWDDSVTEDVKKHIKENK